MHQQALLDELRDEMLAKHLCPALAEQATQLVMGAGNPAADIMLIGEAPGKKEDQTGEPFVGASGRFLNEMLAAAGLERQDVYITNIVKYRPPNNRDPKKDEIAAFMPYLLRQIAIIQPRVVMTLGRHSGMCFVPELVISKDHGVAREVVMEEYTMLLLPLYHPAAALYNGSMRQTLLDDFLAAVRLAGRAMP